MTYLDQSAKLTFSDEFNSLDLWNGQDGVWETSYDWQGQANGSTLPGEQQWYIDDGFSGTKAVQPWTTSNGILTLTAAKVDPIIQPLINGYAITSGQLNTIHSFSQAYGYFEISAKMPGVDGAWPALWLVSADGTNRYELDVFEMIGRDVDNLVTTLHDKSSGGYTNSQSSEVANMSGGFHVYGVDWQRDYIRWYFDGELVHQVATPATMNGAMFMILNLAVGGGMPGQIDPATFSTAQMKVDYVHVYDHMPSDAAKSVAPGDIDGTLISYGTVQADRIDGAPGNDAIYGDAGDDTIGGGDGNDSWLFGDAGDDVIRGGAGNDVIGGGAGNDHWLSGDNGNDTILGGEGDDTLSGGDGNDGWLSGDAGDDVIHGNAGNDTIAGGDGDDPLLGGDAGEDVIDGGAGNDMIFGDTGNDPWLFGGAGDDAIYGGDGDDVINGGDDGDRWLSGGTGNDTVYGGNGSDFLLGADGGDLLNGGAGNDRISAGTGDDTLFGGSGDDILKGGSGANHYYGGSGHDLFVIDPALPGRHIIEDFQLGYDHLRITGYDLIDLLANATVGAQGITLHLGHLADIDLVGTTLANLLLAGDFLS